MSKRAHRSYTDYEKLDYVERFEKSEKTARAFCREEDLPKSSLSDWLAAKNEGRLTAENCSGGKRKNRPAVKSPLEGTFHRRELLPPAVSFSSPEGRILFQEAMQDGSMESYFHMSEHYITQGHPAFCGIGSLAMALNALLLDPERVWQGVWRWFDESMLDCCQSHDITKLKGISIPKLACVARCNGADVAVKYASDIKLEEFRRDVIAVAQMNSSRTDPYHNANRHLSSIRRAGGSNGMASSKGSEELSMVMIANYCRSSLNQTGTGHFSPIAGYHSGRDMVLIMDVARFKYPPHWVPISALFESMQLVDPATGCSRGYMLLQPTAGLKQRIMHCKCLPGKDGLYEELDDETKLAVTSAVSATNTNGSSASLDQLQSKRRKIVEDRIEALEVCSGSGVYAVGIANSNGTIIPPVAGNQFDDYQPIHIQLERQIHDQHQHEQRLDQRILIQQDQQFQQQQQFQVLQSQQQSRMANGAAVHTLLGIHPQQHHDLNQQANQNILHQHPSQHHQQLIQHQHITQHVVPQQLHNNVINQMVLPSNATGLSAGDMSMLPLQGNLNASTLHMDDEMPLLFRGTLYGRTPKKMAMNRGTVRPNGNNFN